MPKVLIGVPCAENSRWSVFWDALENLERPVGTPPVAVARGPSVAENRNNIVEKARSLKAERIFYLDDDQLFHPSVLLCLLERDLDVVVGLSVAREPPFEPLMYSVMDEKGFCNPRFLNGTESGLVKIIACTSGGFLIKTSVFDKIESPYWTLGQIRKDGWGDDLDLCRKLRDADVSIYCDLDVPFGHITNCAMWPMKRLDGAWETALMKNALALTLPAAISSTSIARGELKF